PVIHRALSFITLIQTGLLKTKT
ncbi:3-isopropylmalate dehydratase small subunit 1, partial [Haemophilus influenzae]